MEIVVGLLALEYNLITESIFVAIVFGAIISSIRLGPWFNYSIKKRKSVSILEFFSSRGIISAFKQNNRNSAIMELCELASRQDDMPEADILYKAVMKREQEMGTGMEEGLAVPHARLSFIKRPAIFFGRSPDGIDWNSPDGHSARFIFLIFTPADDYDSQVQILRFIAKVMSEETTRNTLLKLSDLHDIWALFKETFASKHIIKNQRPNQS